VFLFELSLKYIMGTLWCYFISFRYSFI